jgi:outer membrane protein
MRKKLVLIFICCAISGISFLSAEQLSKIGVIDLSRIASQYFQESRAYRELEEMIIKYEDEKNRIIDEISSLEERKLDAENAGEDTRALRLENEVYDKKEYLKEYTRIKYNQIKSKREKLTESQTFITEIMKEIDYIAESEGFSLILKASDPNLAWWSSEVDVTDLVLERLMRRAAADNS